MNSTYISSKDRIKKPKPSFARIIAATFIAVFFATFGIFASTSKVETKAEAFDAVQWAMCYFGTDSIPGRVYQSAQSSDLQFALRSKSSITGGVSDVESGLNWILDVFGPGFKEVNENVTGYSLDPFVDPEAEPAPAEERFNKGVKVNPFDRFGVAGLNFTAYTGEWKHVVIDACNTNTPPQDPKAGVYYDDRLEPRSTWEDIDNSKDIRTQQFAKGFGSQFGVSMADLFANGIFSVTKTVVVVTVGLINFSFTDIVEVMGLNHVLSNEDGGGIFTALFNGIFTPLIVIVFVITGGVVFFKGIVKRQYRESLTTVLRSVILFMIAIIIAVAPATFISLPNKVAVVSQSIILSTMNTGLAGGSGLCSSNVGSNPELVTNPNAEPADILTQASENMRSAVGCQFWQMFLLKPWAQGQFGTDWEKLYANGKIPEGAPKTAADLKNENEAMVGDAAVPMGGGEFINNWAIFQISAQTNAHSPIGHEGEKSKYTAGVANDWWRIVDTLSNYQEEEATVQSTGVLRPDIVNTVTYTVPKNSQPSQYWDTWVGNSAADRMWTAMSSVIVALIGLAAPLLFAFLSAVYSVGVAFLMAFAPIMLLIGCWAGKGWEIFKGWGELVINTTFKRIATGVLLALAIGLEMAAIRMIDTVGWWQGILMLVIVSVVLIKSRKKIIDALASIKFSSMNFGETASRLNNKTMGAIKAPTRMVASSTMGGLGSMRYGQDFMTGAKAAARDELKMWARRTPSLQSVSTAYDAARISQGDLFEGQNTCSSCGKRIDYEEDQMGMQFFHGARSASGDLYCYQCFQDGVDPEALEVYTPRKDAEGRKSAAEEKKKDRIKERQKIEKQTQELRERRFSNTTAFNSPTSRNNLEMVRTGETSDGEILGNNDRRRLMESVLKAAQVDIDKKRLNGGGMPAIPAEIQDSIDPDLLRTAWETGNYDWIRHAYVAAYAHWFVETTGIAFTKSLEEIAANIQKKDDKKSKGNDE